MTTKDAGSARLPRWVLVGVLVAGFGFASGCQLMCAPQPPPVAVDDIRTLSQTGVSAHDIIQKIQAGGLADGLRASEWEELKAQGVSDDVINYLQQTYLDAMPREQAWYRAHGSPFGDGGYYDEFWWPYPEDITILHTTFDQEKAVRH